MKKIILFFILFVAAKFSFSQDLKKVQNAIILKQPEAAKTELDKVSNDPKAQSNAEFWFDKASIYAALYKDSVLRAKYPNSEITADEAFKKYMQLQPSYDLVKQYGAEPFFDIYSTSFNEGIHAFRNSKWDSASRYFARATEYSDIIFANKWTSTTAPFDTTSLELAGYAFQNSQKPEEAMKYYRRLADAKVGGKDFMDAYKFMLSYYSQQKNDAKFKETIALVKTLYPDQSALWNEFEMEHMAATANVMDILAKYNQQKASGKLTEDQYVSYAEALVQVPKDQLTNVDSAKQVELKMTGAEAFKNAFNLHNNGLYAYNAGVLYYNIFVDLDDRYTSLRGAAADLKARRSEVEKQEYLYADSAIYWLESGYTLLKAKTDRNKTESTSLNKSVDFLANLYLWKRDKSKGVHPADYDKYNAKYTLYDSEHNKYVPK